MEEQEEKVGCFGTIFQYIGMVGFILLTPVLCFYLGFEAPQRLLESVVGDYGSLDFLVFLSFLALGLRIAFGASRLLLPTTIALLASAPLIGTTLQTKTFSGLQDILLSLPYMEHKSLNFMVGIVILSIGVQLSNLKRVNVIAQLVLIVLLPYGALAGLNKFDLVPKNDATSFSMKEGYATASKATKMAISQIDERYRKDPKVQKYIKTVVNDPKTKESEKTSLIDQLKQRIAKLEKDKTTAEQVRQENERFKEELNLLNTQKPADTWCIGARSQDDRIYGYDNAIELATPCVRDLAVHLASAKPGTYHKSGKRGAPTDIGLAQIATIHTYVSDQWKYINDPTRTGADYLSLASRSIALGFAGDCDDFSIVMASLIGAIGGTPRIVHGECSDGGHAWAEVLIGSKSDWDNMQQLLGKHYSDRSRSFSGHNKNGQYWLSLDWRLGELSCAERSVRVQWSHEP